MTVGIGVKMKLGKVVSELISQYQQSRGIGILAPKNDLTEEDNCLYSN